MPSVIFSRNFSRALKTRGVPWLTAIYFCASRKKSVSNVISPIIAILSDKDEQSFVRRFKLTVNLFQRNVLHVQYGILFAGKTFRTFFFNSYHPRLELSFSCKLFIKILEDFSDIKELVKNDFNPLLSRKSNLTNSRSTVFDILSKSKRRI